MIKVRENNRRFIIEVAAFMLILYGNSFCVYLNGDDFMYAAFAKTGILRNVIDYYFTGNGRFWINILDSALLYFDRYAFILVLPWIVLAFVVLFAKNVQRIMSGHSDWKREKNLVRMGMVLFCCLDVMCLRETVFWITGMMNYLFPAVMFLWAYLMFQKSRAGEIVGVAIIGYYVVCALVSSSVEQYALMFVGMMTLHHGYDLIKKRKISGSDWLAYGLSLLGLVVLIFAPGNFQRVEEQQMPGFVDNIWTLVHQNTVHEVALPFFLMVSVIAARVGTQAKRGFFNVCMQGIPVVILALMSTPLANKAIILAALILLWTIGIITLFAAIKNQVKAEFLFLGVVGIGSQLMLLVSAVWGFRCMLSFYIIYILMIGCLLYHADASQRLFVFASGILVSLHPVATLAFWGVTFLLRRKNIFTKKLSTLITCCGSAVALLVLLIGYSQNVQAHKQNLQNTIAQTNQSIVIQELPNDKFSWYFVPISEFHEEYYRLLHDIPENVEIIYEALPE